MRRFRAGYAPAILTALGLSLAAGTARAADCPGNPDALGTSRTIVVDPKEHPRIGTMQYGETLPLEDHEVVLTFDDGPLPAHTNPILDTLAAECVKATFFMVGRMAKAYPQDVRRVHDAGHTIAFHSENHPLHFGKLPPDRMAAEIDDGIAHVTAALGDPSQAAPFFRIPGLRRADNVEAELAKRGLMTWSADFPADDWRHISSGQVIQYALSRLEAKGKGILLLHDIQPRTQAALPIILRQLKERGYRVVHVVPATPDRPKTVTTAAQWVPSWIHRASAAAKPRPDRFVFGAAAVSPRHAPRSARSVWLASQPARMRTSLAVLHQPVDTRFRIGKPVHASFAKKPSALTRKPAVSPVRVDGAPSRPAAKPVKTGSKTNARPT